MRRKDREVTDFKEIVKVIEECDCCRIGLQDGESVYIVPMNFGFKETDGHIDLYFHGAAVGKKIDLIQANPNVGFEMDAGHILVPAKDAAAFTFRYKSVIGHGKIEILENVDEKIAGLNVIMEHYTGKSDWEIPAQVAEHTAVLRISAYEITCKANKPE